MTAPMQPAGDAIDTGPLLGAWMAWDKHPAREATVAAYLAEVRAFAAAVGMRPLDVTRHCAEQRRAGVPRAEILAALAARQETP